jgi:hypothetical protein
MNLSRRSLLSPLLLAFAPGAAAQSQLWIRQLGTTSNDGAYAVAPAGSGGVYVGGDTAGSLDGSNAGGSDAWFAHYDGVM